MANPVKEQTATHVVFLLHGFWGAPSHMFALRDALLAEALQHNASVAIHCCGSYQGVSHCFIAQYQLSIPICSHDYAQTLTYDGVDVCADRVLGEIIKYVQDMSRTGLKPEKFSILG